MSLRDAADTRRSIEVGRVETPPYHRMSLRDARLTQRIMPACQLATAYQLRQSLDRISEPAAPGKLLPLDRTRCKGILHEVYISRCRCLGRDNGCLDDALLCGS